MIFSSPPPQLGQRCRSMSNTRSSSLAPPTRCAPARTGSACSHSARAAAPGGRLCPSGRPLRHHLRPQLCVGRQQLVVPDQVQPRGQHLPSCGRAEGDAVRDGRLQRLRRTRLLAPGSRLGQPGLPHVLDQHAPAREHPGDDGLQRLVHGISLGAAASMNSASPSAPLRYTPSSTRLRR
jgi:hypothetical protein